MNGIYCFFEGLKLVRQPGLRQYVIIPIVINTIVLSVVMIYGFSQYDAWLELIKRMLPDWLSFISSLIGFIAAVVIFTLSVYGFSIIANIIASRRINNARDNALSNTTCNVTSPHCPTPCAPPCAAPPRPLLGAAHERTCPK